MNAVFEGFFIAFWAANLITVLFETSIEGVS